MSRSIIHTSKRPTFNVKLLVICKLSEPKNETFTLRHKYVYAFTLNITTGFDIDLANTKINCLVD